MKNIKYTVWKEDKYYVAQCLNIDISSFGETIDKAVSNLIEAVELYFEGNDHPAYTKIDNVMIGEYFVNV
ncbi:MAG: type II toxin-antitoxin system HicB family antitoxin [Spirochaetota bacterium]